MTAGDKWRKEQTKKGEKLKKKRNDIRRTNDRRRGLRECEEWQKEMVERRRRMKEGNEWKKELNDWKRGMTEEFEW